MIMMYDVRMYEKATSLRCSEYDDLDILQYNLLRYC